jgi:hypothetical protein
VAPHLLFIFLCYLVIYTTFLSFGIFIYTLLIWEKKEGPSYPLSLKGGTLWEHVFS